MMRRVDEEELLDLHAGTEEETQASLRDIRRINVRYGGLKTMRALLERVVTQSGTRELSVLDVAAGSGDVVSAAAQQLRKSGVTPQTTFLDMRVEHLRNAPGSRRVVGDALALPFADSSFDVVTNSLFMHHLAPEQVAAFTREALRVARVAFVINDVERSRLHLWLNYLALPTFSRITRHDAPASVRRAYTLNEAKQMLAQSGAPISRIQGSRHYLYRIGLIAWKQQTASI